MKNTVSRSARTILIMLAGSFTLAISPGFSVPGDAAQISAAERKDARTRGLAACKKKYGKSAILDSHPGNDVRKSRAGYTVQCSPNGVGTNYRDNRVTIPLH